MWVQHASKITTAFKFTVELEPLKLYHYSENATGKTTT